MPRRVNLPGVEALFPQGKQAANAPVAEEQGPRTLIQACPLRPRRSRRSSPSTSSRRPSKLWTRPGSACANVSAAA